MILVTGATGTVGRRCCRCCSSAATTSASWSAIRGGWAGCGCEVRIALGDLAELADPRVLRQALRGVDTVVHLAAAIRDQPRAPVEELNGLATASLLRAAERSRVERFVFFSAIGATEVQRTRFFRAKALAERAVRTRSSTTTVFAPSIVYNRDDPWITMMRRLACCRRSRSPAAGERSSSRSGRATSPRCVLADLDWTATARSVAAPRARRPASASPTTRSRA